MDGNVEYDFSHISKEEINKYCIFESRNCVSVGRLMLLLSGCKSHFEFLSDPVIAHNIYIKAKEDIVNLAMKHDVYKEDIVNLAMKHDVYFAKEVKAGNINAIVEVVYYKKSKLQRPRLVVVGAIEVEYFGKKTHDGLFYRFVRTFHIPFKRQCYIGDLFAQVDTISAGLMPQLLQNADHLLTFISVFGMKIRDLTTKRISFTTVDIKLDMKEVPSTSSQNLCASKIITGDLETQSFTSKDTNFMETDSPVCDYPEGTPGKKDFVPEFIGFSPLRTVQKSTKCSKKCSKRISISPLSEKANSPRHKVPKFQLLDERDNKPNFDVILVDSEDACYEWSDFDIQEFENFERKLKPGLASENAIKVVDNRVGQKKEFPIVL